MSGPSKRSLAGHHLTEAIKHLYAAAEFVRETDHDDAAELAAVAERAAETARDVRGEIEPQAKQIRSA
ncbi:MAG TPA: hypothetical protein VLE97_09065 [Gaiellaceae bacterium]|nr:hypothetical protein [Gaiellaceae bacterium]